MNNSHFRAQSLLAKYDLYSFVTCFLLCSFFGWCYETLAIFVGTGHLTTRGLLFVGHSLSTYMPLLRYIMIIGEMPLVWGLPIIIIYGVGGCIISVVLRKHTDFLSIFFTGMVLMTVLELGGSFFLRVCAGANALGLSYRFYEFSGQNMRKGLAHVGADFRFCNQDSGSHIVLDIRN